jgi:hypothetical protein
MNHFISAICWSLLSVDGWNSLSIHFLASASPAHGLAQASAAAAASATRDNAASLLYLLVWLPRVQ